MLELQHIEKNYVKGIPVLKDVSFELTQGEIIALVGESGCGKTTLLRSIAGFESIQKGNINLEGKELANEHVHLEPEHRNIGFLFQDYALFPHLTVEQNIRFGLNKISRSEQKERIHEVLSLLGVEELIHRYPHELSGGQQQRIALARSLAPKPGILLMDEPFSNIDGLLKSKVLSELRSLLKASKVSVIVVTHDMKEAIQFSDKIVVLKDGKVEQFGTPEEIYNTPSSEYVADYFGASNFIPVELNQGKVLTQGISELTVSIKESTGGKGKLLIRYHDVELAQKGNGIEAKLKHQMFEGSQYLNLVETKFGEIQFYSELPIPTGETIQISFKPKKYTVLSE